MATASHISLTPATAGSFHVGSISSQSSDIASSLLQTNHEKNHMYFNDDGFHNHIVHHLLTIFALGASPSEIQRGFDHNNNYQKPQKPVSDRNVQQMSDPDKFKSFLGKQQHFHDYLTFFTNEISAKGWQNTLLEHLFSGTPHSEDLLKRMCGGFYHPIIHLGFGIEFSQPAIIAEALAQAATHDNWIAKLLDPVEQIVHSNPSTTSKPLVQLLHSARSNPKLSTAAHWNDGNKVRDGVIARASEEMINLASQFRVSPENLDRKIAEVINAAVYFTGFSQRRNKIPKIDFYFMHCANSAIFWPVFMKQEWLGVKEKCRLVQWKGWIDLAMYVSRRTPELLVEDVRNYRPKHPEQKWEDVFRRVDRFEDDGHASKLIRVLARGEEVCREFYTKSDTHGEKEDEDLPVRQQDWLTLAHLVMDSVEDVRSAHWVRSAGFDEAWADIPDRAKL